MLTDKSIEQLNQPTAEIGGKTFYFRKMGPFKQLPIVEQIRSKGIRDILAAMPTRKVSDFGEGEEAESLLFEQKQTDFLLGILSADEELIKYLLDKMFQYVDYTDEDSPDPVTLRRKEEGVFAKMDVFAIYEVLLRALVVNFLDSSLELLSRIGVLRKVQEEAQEESKPSTSTPSLPSQ